jgi:tetratricopeptide (TPR) repeat protein
MPMLWADFRSSYAAGEKNSAGNTLQRLAYCYQQMRRTDSALVLARQALQMTAKQLDAGYKPHYHTNALRSMALILQGSGQYDSALVYTQRYFLMKDSLNQRLWEKRAKQVGSQLAYDQMQHRVQTLMQERKTSRLLRNALVAGLILLAFIGWLWAINQRRRQQLKQADAHYQQQLADRRMQHLQEQLADLTRQMTEKNDLLQILQAQTSGQNAEAVEALRQARLLTESDWLQFKHLFEQVQPGFLQRLRQLVPDVTSAEMRYASLLRLQLGAKDIAAMLGVSPDAVRKTKSRLRQRLPAAHADQPLEELVQVL